LLVTLIIGSAEADQGAAETHESRYMMGTSIEVQAFGGDAAIRKSAIDEGVAGMRGGRSPDERCVFAVRLRRFAATARQLSLEQRGLPD